MLTAIVARDDTATYSLHQVGLRLASRLREGHEGPFLIRDQRDHRPGLGTHVGPQPEVPLRELQSR